MLILRLGLTAVLCAGCGGRTAAEPTGDDDLMLAERPSLRESTIEELQNGMRSGALTSTQIVQWYLERIEKLDRSGPMLRSVIAVAPDALSQAGERDRQRAAGAVRGPLHGIPLLIKDNIETRELPTTAGSLALENNRTERDAKVVEALRKAGAVILGKANLSEFANFRGDKSSSGWSAVAGQVRNPYDTAYSPCGSSAGSAVAVSANLASAAVGTETDGSVVCPAAFTGIVGLKPSRGLLPTEGIVPISELLDTAGPMARTVSDAAILFSVMRGDSFKETTALNDALKAATLSEKRIGVMRLQSTAELAEFFDEKLAQMRDAGALLIPVEPFVTGQHRDSEFELLISSFKHDFDAYFRSLPNQPFSGSALSSVVAYNRKHADRELKYFGQELFELALSKEIDAASNAKNDVVEELQKLFQAQFEKHELDAVVLVTAPRPTPINWEQGDDFPDSPWASTYAAVTGFAHVTVPAGLEEGLPIGLSFIGLPNRDVDTLALAHAFENTVGERVQPKF